MSEIDSFVEEVSEEVRRDRLFGYVRRYGWIALAAILLIVGGATYNEYRKAQTRADNEAAGDAILAALEAETAADRVDALAALSFEDQGRLALVKMAEAAVLVEDDRPEEAAAVLQTVTDIPDMPAVYADLAKLKLAMLQPESAEAIAALDGLAVPGRPYRLLALEQRALAHMRAGDTAAALADLKAIWEDPGATQDIRQRTQQLTLVLGGELTQTPALLPVSGDG